MLACLNPGAHQFNETRNVLMYVLRATRVMVEEQTVKREGGDGDAGGEEEVEEEKVDDPMEGDFFDPDEVQNRHVEVCRPSSNPRGDEARPYPRAPRLEMALPPLLVLWVPLLLHRSSCKQHPPNQHPINQHPTNQHPPNHSTPKQHPRNNSPINQHPPNQQFIETNSFGSIFSRCSGDPADPLILFVHGAAGGRAKDSRMFNGMVTAFALEMQRAEEEAARLAKEEVHPSPSSPHAPPHPPSVHTLYLNA